MTYYRVKPEYDNAARMTKIGHSNLKAKYDGILVANELYTPNERAKLLNHDKCFEEVDVKKNQTYWFFGARFEHMA